MYQIGVGLPRLGHGSGSGRVDLNRFKLNLGQTLGLGIATIVDAASSSLPFRLNAAPPPPYPRSGVSFTENDLQIPRIFLRFLSIPNPNRSADATVSSSDELPTTPPNNKRTLLSPDPGYSQPKALEKISEKINPKPKQSPYFAKLLSTIKTPAFPQLGVDFEVKPCEDNCRMEQPTIRSASLVHVWRVMRWQKLADVDVWGLALKFRTNLHQAAVKVYSLVTATCNSNSQFCVVFAFPFSMETIIFCEFT
ncbi:serine/threonine-protein kinase KIPK-like protein [Corchorus olitorius]|uniref:Serine/threonine-protein kinase KIPK-like protein n=1 Tax=Corchorus olitorius TaxID=93759 RepID=A0A1R3I8M3_9ROSI|nr:serine/threonine-protein kinase KIPK-like protein [Corchorus olitorius]